MSNSTTPGGGGSPPPIVISHSLARQASVINAFVPNANLIAWLVMSSILSWARDKDRKLFGWWGSVVNGRDGKFGSFLWRLERSKLTDKAANDARIYLEEALAWMATDGIVDSISVETGRESSRLWVTIEVKRGEIADRLDFADLWEIVFA